MTAAPAPAPPRPRPGRPGGRRAGGAAATAPHLRGGAGLALLLLAPAGLLVCTFLLIPSVWTLALGATDLRLTGLAAASPRYVGAQNLADALADPLLGNAVRVTLLFVLGSGVLGQAGLGLALAWLGPAWPRRLRAVVEVVVVLAWLVPSSVVAFLWVALLDRDGTLNLLLPGPDVTWLLDAPLLSVTVFNTWRGTAFAMLLFSAALRTVPPSQLETARLAGASSWRQLVDVVVPRIRGHLVTGVLLLSLSTFNTFTPYLLTAGGPNFATETLPIYVYRTAFSSGRLGFGAAVSVVLLAINLLAVVVLLRLRGRPA